MAFTITALALGLVYQIYGKGTTALVLSDQYARAAAIAESHLAQAQVPSADGGARSGRDQDLFDWTLQRHPYTAGADAYTNVILALDEIRVDVSWSEGGRTRTLSLNSLVPVAPP